MAALQSATSWRSADAPRRSRILQRRRVASPFTHRVSLHLPGLVDRKVLDKLELLPNPEGGFDLGLPDCVFAHVPALDFDGPTLLRLVDRLQVFTPAR